MKKCIFVFIFFNVILTYSNAQDVPKAELKYSKDLQKIISKIKNKKSIELAKLENVIPKTEIEFIIYYSYTYPDQDEITVNSFYFLDSLFYRNAELNKLNFTKKVIMMADIVDGGYAEKYYEYLEIIIKKNKKCFCKTYSKLSKSSKEWLEESFIEHCKKLAFMKIYLLKNSQLLRRC
jgi:hypothetical protein